MLGMLSCAVIPLGIIVFCAWHEEYVGRRRARLAAEIERDRQDCEQLARYGLRLHKPSGVWQCDKCKRWNPEGYECRSATCELDRRLKELDRNQKSRCQKACPFKVQNCSACNPDAPDESADLGGLAAP